MFFNPRFIHIHSIENEFSAQSRLSRDELVELTKISMSNSFENESVIAQQFFLVVSLIVVDHFRSRLRNEKEKSVIQERMI